MRHFLPVFFLLSGFLVAGGANAAMTISAAQVGADVVFTFSGNINTGGLTSFGSGGCNFHQVDVGIVFNSATTCQGFQNSFSSTPSGYVTTSSSTSTFSINSGNEFGINGADLFVPSAYVSGNPISSTMTFTNTTLAGMSLVVGTYVWTLTNSDTVTLTVGAAAVPTLSEWAQLMLALMTITLVGWHFHRERSY